ncbi:MAG: ABC transporter substrate-binding protein [Capsulimonadales bacterium]|nr:ABC transporter substrate-binding protein [Capsulimonadales bacterium]
MKKCRLSPLLLPGILLLSAWLLSGCSNNPYPPGESYGNVIYRSMSDDPKSLDPSFSYTVDEAYITDLVYPSYYKYEYLKRPFEVTLNLGAKEPIREPWQTTVRQPDGTTRTVTGEKYTFTIKNDLRFQDDPVFPEGKGRPITANDIVYSFKRMCDAKVQCPVASFFADKVIGWEEYSQGFATGNEAARIKHYDDDLPGVRVDKNDPYTFYIFLNQPYPQLKYLMAMHFTTPQAREAVEFYKDEYARHMVGCGPYRMAEYKPKQRITLVANPNRHKDYYPTEGEPGDREKGLLEDAGKPLPLNDKVVVNIIREGTSAWNLFRQGYLDAAGVGNTNYQQVVGTNGLLTPQMEQKGIQLRKDTQVNVYYLAFNLLDPVWGGYTPAKRKLRQAVSLAVDSREFIDLMRQGNGVPAEWLLPPGVFAYDPDYKNPYKTADLEKAKKLLAEAGYPNGNDPKTGRKLVLNFDNTGINAAGRILTGLIQRQIERIGIKVESRATRPDLFQDKLLKNQHQFIYYGWFADYPDPENFVFLLYGPNKKPGPNSSNYANPEYDALFERMRSMENSPERVAIIQRMRDLAVEDVPWIPIYHEVALSVGYDWMKNVKAHPIDNSFNQYRRVDVAERTRKQKEWNQPNYLPVVLLLLAIIGSILPAINVVARRINRRVRRPGAEHSMEGGGE